MRLELTYTDIGYVLCIALRSPGLLRSHSRVEERPLEAVELLPCGKVLIKLRDSAIISHDIKYSNFRNPVIALFPRVATGLSRAVERIRVQLAMLIQL
jgi:hypothetical protein